jgi:CRISPR system Cascade subunit CasA
MVTLIRPTRAALWPQLWANVPLGAPAAAADLPRIFPWLAPTLVSDGGRTVVPEEDAHPLQAFWGMPRRIRLEFADAADGVRCDITGRADTRVVTGWRQRPRGANYAQWGLRHPLTPHYRVKANAEWLPVHPQPGGVGYRHWLGLVVATGDRLPARIIATWGDRLRDAGADPATAVRLLAAGYDMDNMKARAFVESEMPLPGAADPDAQAAVDQLARALVESADAAARLLRQTVRNALFSAGASVKYDAELLASTGERLWESTERRFFDALTAAAARPAAALATELEPERAEWARLLRHTAMALFDEAAPLTPQAGADAARIAKSRRNLSFALSGYGRDGAALFQALGLSPPISQAARRSA